MPSDDRDRDAEEVGHVQGLIQAASSERGKPVWAFAAFAMAGGVAVTALQDFGGYSPRYSALFAVVAAAAVVLALLETWNVYTGVYDGN